MASRFQALIVATAKVSLTGSPSEKLHGASGWNGSPRRRPPPSCSATWSIAAIRRWPALGRSEAACRRMVHRARKRVREGTPPFEVDEAAHRRLVEGYARAVEAGDADRLGPRPRLPPCAGRCAFP